MVSDFEIFRSKIINKKSKVTVVGVGYVGLATTLFFADSGYNTSGVDINEEKINSILNKNIDLNEEDLNRLLIRIIDANKIKLYTKIPENYQSNIWIIATDTPLNDDLTPDLNSLESAVQDINEHISNDVLIIIESTVPVGTIENLVYNKLKKHEPSYNIWVAYCPERILPGKIYYEYKNLTRVIGGINKESTELAFGLYKNVVNGKLIKSTSIVAELVKLAENSYRNINIAFANELALICNRYGVSAYDVIELANLHPRVNILKPGCGVGGHCIPKDPMLLFFSSIQKNFTPNLIKYSREVNENMPIEIIKILKEILKKNNLKLEGLNIAVLGVTYKGNSDDLRNTPIKTIIQLLLNEGAFVKSFDPYTDEGFNSVVVNTLDDAIKNSQLVFIGTDHKIFENFDFKKVNDLSNGAIIFDGRGIIKNKEDALKYSIKYFSL